MQVRAIYFKYTFFQKYKIIPILLNDFLNGGGDIYDL